MQARRTTTRRSLPAARALAGLLLATALAVTGCSGSDAGSDAGGNAKAAAPQQGSQAEGSQADGRAGAAGEGGADRAGASAPPKLTPTHIIRTVSLSVQVKDTPKALDAARTATENAGGYVGDESTTRDAEGHERTEVTLRVPVERYEDVLDDLEGAGKLLRRDAKAEDVTDQVVDVDSRVKSQRASVARVRELMDRATQLSDVVSLEGELSTRQAELEALLARQAALRDRTSLATITLSLSETPVRHEEKKEDEDPGFTDALAGGWDAFVTMLRWVAVVLGAVAPFAAVAALLALLWLRVVRPRLPRRPEAPRGGEPGARD
ncbi:DUF4349 domain-containing protein [Streptomyces sp. CB09001]|uniref:DUF4349 domain-containing protein n=1 Tax=unclassified Streptomyces TaxID=2593676 RepID=UPI000E20FD54|nr:DUF4349 domain-containing protein [Streptomyces sp. CB09001]AXL91602.1 DUF4349 domain-containing protein [Streptomyces sp. CB09001]